MGMYSFLDSVYRGTQAEPSFTHGAYVQRVMDAALRSDAAGKEMEV
jgi:hypothetical protein